MLNIGFSIGYNNIDNIDIILWKNNELYKILQKINFYQRLNPKNMTISVSKNFNLEIESEFNEFYTRECLFIKSILSDLRSDLQLRLTEQQSTLESAKSEVEKNITGTTELNQVSELQRARLDKQIEQFEELQRVLVKI